MSILNRKFKIEPKASAGKISVLTLIIFSIFAYILIDAFINTFRSSGGKTSSTQQESNSGFFEKTKKVLQSQEKRFGCEDGKIENLTDIDLTKAKTRYHIMDGIRINRVEYPLNKDEVMMEYCFRVANLTSEMGGRWITAKLLDKDKNVLAENEKRVADIPGKRIKTVYGSIFIDTKLANEVTGILVGK